MGVIRVMPVLRVVRLCPFSRYRRCSYGVLCLVHAMQEMHVLSPNHFLLKIMSYTHQVSNVSRAKRSNFYPSNSVLSVMRDMRGMHVIHVMSHTLLLQ